MPGLPSLMLHCNIHMLCESTQKITNLRIKIIQSSTDKAIPIVWQGLCWVHSTKSRNSLSSVICKMEFKSRVHWSPCSPRDSQESSPTPQFKSINSSALRTQQTQSSLYHCFYTWFRTPWVWNKDTMLLCPIQHCTVNKSTVTCGVTVHDNVHQTPN